MIVLRRTKIIATLGPATDKASLLHQLLDAGVDIVRINFSHGSHADHMARVEQVRAYSKQHSREIGILADLQGPKIRIAKFQQGSITLNPGDKFTLDAALDDTAGSQTTVGIDYKNLPNDVKPNDTLLLNDGMIELRVDAIENTQIHCTVREGGELSNNKGINRLGGGLSAQALTDKDKKDLKAAVKMGVDYIAISFPRCAEDIRHARQLIAAENSYINIIAKIERCEALNALDEIIEASDAVMVARGDLGVEVGDAELPGIQKQIIHAARRADKAVITATQMMESMVKNPIPSRAEVSDVANAVLDGTDAVMLSAETATGQYPIKVVESMSRICLGAEKHKRASISRHRINEQFDQIDEAIAMAVMYTANHIDIRAIITLTESGSTPLWMSRIRSNIPIFALSRHITTQRKMSLYRGVYPIAFDVTTIERVKVNMAAIAEVQRQGFISTGDRVIVTKGDLMGVHGTTNSLKIICVP